MEWNGDSVCNGIGWDVLGTFQELCGAGKQNAMRICQMLRCASDICLNAYALLYAYADRI